MILIRRQLPRSQPSYVNVEFPRYGHLWNTGDLGYRTVFAADGLSKATFKNGDTKIKAPRLNDIEVVGDEVRLGKPFTRSWPDIGCRDHRLLNLRNGKRFQPQEL